MNRTQAALQAPVRMGATIRRPDAADVPALTSFFDELSMRTRVLRFFAPVRPTAALVRLACGFAARAGGDGRPSRAGGTDALIAVHDGVIIGHAMAADRPVDRPAEAPADQPAKGPAPLKGPVTEIGVVVADAWQGRGVGAALVRALINRAQARGVTSLSMDVLPANQQVLAMIARHWTVARTGRAADCVTIQTALAPDEAPPIPDQRTPARPAPARPAPAQPEPAQPAPAGVTQRELAYHGEPGPCRKTA